MKSRSQKGITVLELLVAVGIISVVTGIGLTYYSKSRKNLREVNFVNVMRQVAKRVEKIAQNPEAIAFSAAQSVNRRLANCAWTRELASEKDYSSSKVRDSSGEITYCDVVDPNEQVEFNLYVPPKDLSNYNAEQRIVSGGAGDSHKDGVWYDIRGKRGCDPVKDPYRCIIQVKTYFWATCPRGANEIRREVRNSNYNAPLSSNCYRAQSINIRYQVKHVHKKRDRAPSAQTRLRRQLPSIPRDGTFWLNGKEGKHSTEHASPIDVAQLGRYSDYTGGCPPNYTLIEVKDSEPVCNCLPPYRETGSALSKVCILDNHKCKADERYMGTKIDGSSETAVCEPVICKDKTYTVDEEIGFVFDCGPYGWLNGIWGSPTGKNCTCKNTIKQPNLELGTFREACDLHCTFTIRCCRER